MVRDGPSVMPCSAGMRGANEKAMFCSCQIRRSRKVCSNRARPSGRSNSPWSIDAVQATLGGESERAGFPVLYRRYRKNHKTIKWENHNLWSKASWYEPCQARLPLQVTSLTGWARQGGTGEQRSR